MDDETLVGIAPKHLREIRRLLSDYIVTADAEGWQLSDEDIFSLRAISGLISGILGGYE